MVFVSVMIQSFSNLFSYKAMGCCTSTPPEHCIQSNIQPLLPENKVSIEQHHHIYIVPDDTWTDDETETSTNTISNGIYNEESSIDKQSQMASNNNNNTNDLIVPNALETNDICME
eukprot:554703_1